MAVRSTASAAEPYSPRRRTALVFSGTGADGAYHAGVLRALEEAGTKIDVVAGRGVGVIAALLAAIDGGQRLAGEKGFWQQPSVRRFYQWRSTLRASVWTLWLAVATVVLPLGVMVAGLLVFPVDFLLTILGLSPTDGLVERYLTFARRAFAPEALPTWLPRIVLVVLGASVALLLARAVFSGAVRHRRGAFWWRLIPAPLSGDAIVARVWATLWDTIRGAARVAQPAPLDLARRYTEMLEENIGQPGFRELVITSHDIDARRDLVGALVAGPRRRDLIRRATSEEAGDRRAEVVDLSGVARDHLADIVAGALAIPLATEPRAVKFAADSFWRGEVHRLCDRPSALVRLLEEVTAAGVEQIVLVSAAAEPEGPHALTRTRVDGRGRLGEYLQSTEASVVRDVARSQATASLCVYTIRPAYNPIGPLDFGGGIDDRSDRRLPLSELENRGYQDAYHQFIEPVVAASGDRVGLRAEH